MFYCFLISKKNLILSFYVIIALFTSIVAYAAKNTQNEIDAITVPIIMYHSISQNTSRLGKYVVSPETIENDISFLKQNGYETIFISDLIRYVYDDVPLPEKPVILSFDDGYYNNIVYLPEILKKYNAKATIAVVGEFTDKFSEADSHNVNFSHLTWEDLQAVSKSEYFEVSNHTYNMHSTDGRVGCFKLKNETDEQYKENLTSDIMKMQKALEEKANIKCTVFTYPYGKTCDSSVDIIKEMGFKASLSCYERLNTITKDKNCLYLLGRYNRPYNISTEKFMKKMKIYQNK